MGKNQKNDESKTSVLLKVAGWGWATVIVAVIGFFTNSYLKQSEAKEAELRLYTELISRREQAESDLRKDMFTTIIEDLLQGQSASLEAQVLQLELLAYNFHESLDLKPLFVNLKKRIEKERRNKAEKQYCLDRLTDVAREVCKKQIAILEMAGKSLRRTIDFEDLHKKRRVLLVNNERLKLNGITRNFQVTAREVAPNTNEALIALVIAQTDPPMDLNDSSEPPWHASNMFPIGPFDFPMIENTRLSHDQRCAVVIERLGDSSMEIVIIYFPGSHASLREKAYYNEILQRLYPHN